MTELSLRWGAALVAVPIAALTLGGAVTWAVGHDSIPVATGSVSAPPAGATSRESAALTALRADVAASARDVRALRAQVAATNARAARVRAGLAASGTTSRTVASGGGGSGRSATSSSPARSSTLAPRAPAAVAPPVHTTTGASGAKK